MVICFNVPCECMLLINKAVTVISSDGAAATVIDARALDITRNVLITTGGATFGRPGQGFLVTTPRPDDGGASTRRGIVVRTATAIITVHGHQVIDSTPAFATQVRQGLRGIELRGPGPVVIEGNQVIGWVSGIAADNPGPDTVIKRNHVSLSFTGIQSRAGGHITGNVLAANGIGVETIDASVVGNAFMGNTVGVFVGDAGFPIITRNNFSGNDHCGVTNEETPGLHATKNWWGAATGPVIVSGSSPFNPLPPDQACNESAAATPVVSPFATKPFAIAPPLKP
jgi:hypothetical protein